jgi:hypothetical protein
MERYLKKLANDLRNEFAEYRTRVQDLPNYASREGLNGKILTVEQQRKAALYGTDQIMARLFKN